MKQSVMLVFVLTFIAVVSGGVLALLDQETKPAIAKNRQKELEAAIAQVIPSYDKYEKIQLPKAGLTLFQGIKAETPVGVAFRAIGTGFQGKISIMVGVKPDFSEITGIKVIEHIETPGLGTKIVDDPSNKKNSTWFPDQFKGLLAGSGLKVLKNQKATQNTEIEAISGATISSKAVAKIVDDNIKIAKQHYLKP